MGDTTAYTLLFFRFCLQLQGHLPHHISWHFFLFNGFNVVNFFPWSQVPVVSWFDDFSDMELLELIPLLEKLNEVDDVCAFLRNDNVNTLKTRCHPFDTSWFTVNHFYWQFSLLFWNFVFQLCIIPLSKKIMVVILLLSLQCIFLK